VDCPFVGSSHKTKCLANKIISNTILLSESSVMAMLVQALMCVGLSLVAFTQASIARSCCFTSRYWSIAVVTSVYIQTNYTTKSSQNILFGISSHSQTPHDAFYYHDERRGIFPRLCNISRSVIPESAKSMVRRGYIIICHMLYYTDYWIVRNLQMI